MFLGSVKLWLPYSFLNIFVFWVYARHLRANYATPIFDETYIAGKKFSSWTTSGNKFNFIGFRRAGKG